MKTRIAYFLFVIGLLTIISQTVYRVLREKDIIEIQMQVQRSSLEEGLQSSWKSFLLEKARAGELKPAYSLLWNRKGTELRGVFFPLKQSNLDWNKYRQYRIDKDEAKALKFLSLALKRNESWDRVLAIDEWRILTGSYPETQTDYERALVDAESKNAYRAIFQQFSQNKDFTFASNVIEFDQVFYRVTEDGSIEAFVPSVAAVKEKLLPQFIRNNNLPTADIVGLPWNLSLPPTLTEKVTFSYFDFIWLGLGLTFLVVGVVLYFGGLQEQKAVIIRRVSFLNQVVHELKTPLAGLKLHLQLVKKGLGTEENMKALDLSLNRLNRLFDDVVLMNRPFEKVSPGKIAPDLLREFINELKDEFGPLIVGEMTASEFLADQKRLRVILRNLIRNAIKYGKTAHLYVSQDTEFVYIDVRDEGAGVASGESQKIFEEFFRSEEAKTKNTDGLGLGLFLARKMAREMNAELQLMNPGQANAIFRLILRRAL